MESNRVAVYPGTFDPITNGHMDIIKRATKLFDCLIIAVGEYREKNPLFTLEERLDMVRTEVQNLTDDKNIQVCHLDKLLMNFAIDMHANFVVRGLRAVSDFEYELQMANMNARLNPKIETVFLMASEQNLFIASSLVREVSRLGGDVSMLVSSPVAYLLKQRYSERQA